MRLRSKRTILHSSIPISQIPPSRRHSHDRHPPTAALPVAPRGGRGHPAPGHPRHRGERLRLPLRRKPHPSRLPWPHLVAGDRRHHRRVPPPGPDLLPPRRYPLSLRLCQWRGQRHTLRPHDAHREAHGRVRPPPGRLYSRPGRRGQGLSRGRGGRTARASPGTDRGPRGHGRLGGGFPRRPDRPRSGRDAPLGRTRGRLAGVRHDGGLRLRAQPAPGVRQPAAARGRSAHDRHGVRGPLCSFAGRVRQDLPGVLLRRACPAGGPGLPRRAGGIPHAARALAAGHAGNSHPANGSERPAAAAGALVRRGGGHPPPPLRADGHRQPPVPGELFPAHRGLVPGARGQLYRPCDRAEQRPQPPGPGRGTLLPGHGRPGHGGHGLCAA